MSVTGGDGSESFGSEWLSVREAAAILGGVSPKTIYKLFHDGELSGARIASCIRLHAASVREYLKENSNRKPEPAGEQDKPLARPASTGAKKANRKRGADPLSFRFFPRETLPVDGEG